MTQLIRSLRAFIVSRRVASLLPDDMDANSFLSRLLLMPSPTNSPTNTTRAAKGNTRFVHRIAFIEILPRSKTTTKHPANTKARMTTNSPIVFIIFGFIIRPFWWFWWWMTRWSCRLTL